MGYGTGITVIVDSAAFFALAGSSNQNLIINTFRLTEGEALSGTAIEYSNTLATATGTSYLDFYSDSGTLMASTVVPECSGGLYDFTNPPTYNSGSQFLSYVLYNTFHASGTLGHAATVATPKLSAQYVSYSSGSNELALHADTGTFTELDTIRTTEAISPTVFNWAWSGIALDASGTIVPIGNVAFASDKAGGIDITLTLSGTDYPASDFALQFHAAEPLAGVTLYSDVIAGVVPPAPSASLVLSIDGSDWLTMIPQGDIEGTWDVTIAGGISANDVAAAAVAVITSDFTTEKTRYFNFYNASDVAITSLEMAMDHSESTISGTGNINNDPLVKFLKQNVFIVSNPPTYATLSVISVASARSSGIMTGDY